MYYIFVIVFCSFVPVLTQNTELNITLTKIWGPGLKPEIIVMPARYFFIALVNNDNQRINESLVTGGLQVEINGLRDDKKACRLWNNILDLKDGTYIARYKQYEACAKVAINIKYKNQHIAESPYKISHVLYPEECYCPTLSLKKLITSWYCENIPTQITNDLDEFDYINWNKIREEVIKEYDKPHSVSLCHYVVKLNKVYRRCYGKYVGFNMFMDSILLSLTRKASVPDIEFFVNLGDWPLASKSLPKKFPIFSWCGSTESYDITMPTYDLTESTLENMGRVMLDMLSVQGNVDFKWKKRIPKMFWRGRDSNQQRLDLIKISRDYPELFNVSLTNFFFFRDQEHIYGPKTEYVSFFKFFDYKYQLALDGTVAAYRMPYLLGGGSLVFKPPSKYYEHFYNDLVPYQHYIPIEKDLSDLVEKIHWAIEHDAEAEKIARNGQIFANERLLPKNIFCYYAYLLTEFSKKVTSKVRVLEGMEEVTDSKRQSCDCKTEYTKDEL